MNILCEINSKCQEKSLRYIVNIIFHINYCHYHVIIIILLLLISLC
jgi:hypothetical protein